MGIHVYLISMSTSPYISLKRSHAQKQRNMKKQKTRLQAYADEWCSKLHIFGSKFVS